jgi:hypothetical protein
MRGDAGKERPETEVADLVSVGWLGPIECYSKFVLEIEAHLSSRARQPLVEEAAYGGHFPRSRGQARDCRRVAGAAEDEQLEAGASGRVEAREFHLDARSGQQALVHRWELVRGQAERFHPEEDVVAYA